MKISTKGRYALRMLLDLAEHSGGEYVSLKDVAARQGISKKYLEQIVPVLNRSGILKTNRGYQGGYKLSKSPEKYTLGDILRLTEGSLAPVPCVEQDPPECPRAGDCVMLEIWRGLGDAINNYVDSITLQDIIDRSRENYSNDYVI